MVIAMDFGWDDARARHDAGQIGGAELACAYVADQVRRIAGNRWLQGPRRPALDPGPDAPALVRMFAERELHRLPRPVSEALVAWSRGERRVELGFTMPSARAMLAMQARGRRCVSLLPDEVAPDAPGKAYGGGGLGFVVHDLCHLEKFNEPEHHVGQVGFFAALERALEAPAWAVLESTWDARWRDDRDHVVADMNGSPVFLFVVLRNKLKLAVRRRVAEARGEACRGGELDAEEARGYAEGVEALLEALGLEGALREAGRAMVSKHDVDGAAARLTAGFEARGREALAGAE
jgi:hypothetical protein